VAAYGTLTIAYGPYYDAALLSVGDIPKFFIKPGAPDPDSGAISAEVATAVTLVTPADGTLMANNAAATQIALTMFNGAHIVSLGPAYVGAFLRNPERQKAQIRAFASALGVKAEAEIIADLVAGTPVETETLPNGQMDFRCPAGTDAQVWLAKNALDKAIAAVEIQTQGKPRNIAIIAGKAAYGNLKSLRNFKMMANDFDRLGNQWLYDGYPILLTSVTTNFGGASAECAYVVHQDAEGLVWDEIDLPDGGFAHHGDGFQKLIMQGYAWAGLLQSTHYAAVLSGTS